MSEFRSLNAEILHCTVSTKRERIQYIRPLLSRIEGLSERSKEAILSGDLDPLILHMMKYPH